MNTFFVILGIIAYIAIGTFVGGYMYHKKYNKLGYVRDTEEIVLASSVWLFWLPFYIVVGKVFIPFVLKPIFRFSRKFT